MSTYTHTPGPWKADTAYRITIRPPNGHELVVGYAYGPKWADSVPNGDEATMNPSVVMANLRLMASAPELLAERDALRAALERLLESRCKSAMHVMHAQDEARAALALGGKGQS